MAALKRASANFANGRDDEAEPRDAGDDYADRDGRPQSTARVAQRLLAAVLAHDEHD